MPIIILFMILLFVSSCGGGNGNYPLTANTLPTCASLLRTSVVGSAGVIVVVNNAMNQGEKNDFISQINDIRQQGNCSCPATATALLSTHGAVTSLNWNSTLEVMASNHSEDMMINNYFSHTGFNGSSMAQRASASGYAFSALAENIAAGQATVTDVINSWLSSGGHCRNIMAVGMVDLGAGMARNNGTATYSTYWTMVTGSPI